MNDYELQQFCETNDFCDYNCMQCPAFAQNVRDELGFNDYNDNEEYEDDE